MNSIIFKANHSEKVSQDQGCRHFRENCGEFVKLFCIFSNQVRASNSQGEFYIQIFAFRIEYLPASAKQIVQLVLQKRAFIYLRVLVGIIASKCFQIYLTSSNFDKGIYM